MWTRQTIIDYNTDTIFILDLSIDNDKDDDYVPSNNAWVDTSKNASFDTSKNNNSVASTDESFAEISILKDGNSKFIESLNVKVSSGFDDENLIVEVSNNSKADDKFHFCIFCRQLKNKLEYIWQPIRTKKLLKNFLTFHLVQASEKKILI